MSFKRKDQLFADVIWSYFVKVPKSNSRFNDLDTLLLTVHSVKMPVGFRRCALKGKCRPLSIMAHPKQCIVEVKAKDNCLAHGLIKAISRLQIDPNNNSY